MEIGELYAGGREIREFGACSEYQTTSNTEHRTLKTVAVDFKDEGSIQPPVRGYPGAR
jgi:hypothetical protein